MIKIFFLEKKAFCPTPGARRLTVRGKTPSGMRLALEDVIGIYIYIMENYIGPIYSGRHT